MIFCAPRPEMPRPEWQVFTPLWPRWVLGVGYVWLQPLERRYCEQGHWGGVDCWTEYRLPR